MTTETNFFEWDTGTPDISFDTSFDTGMDYTFDDGSGYTFDMSDPSGMFVYDDTSWDQSYDDMFTTDYDTMFPDITDQNSDPSMWDYANTPLGTGLILGGISGLAGAISSESAQADAEKRAEDNRTFLENQNEANRQHDIEMEQMREEAALAEIEAEKKAPGKADPTVSNLGAVPAAPFRKRG